MESLSLSHSVVNNLNATLAKNAKIQKHLQTGRRVMDTYDDAGALSVNTRTNTSLLNNQKIKDNLENAMSFVQAQDGALTVIGKILSRSSELKLKFDSSLSNESTKLNYDEEFAEIQKELRQMSSSKWNGISLFSVGATNVLLGTANDPHNLNALNDKSVIAIQRSQIFDSFKITKTPPSITATSDSTGGSGESRTTINLLGPTGTLTWWQWPYGASDNFKVTHGTETLHDATYGGTVITMKDGRVLTPIPGTNHGGAAGFPDSAWLKDPNRYNKNKDEIRFGDNGNKSKTLEMIVNESDQVGGTGWHNEYKVEYDPYPVSLIDSSRTWSLNDFAMSDFNTFEDVLSTARAQNGAEQSRIHHEIAELQAKQMGLEKALEGGDGLDYSLALTRSSRLQDRLHLNANLVATAKEMENVLYTDFLGD